jgi:ribosomal protein S17E
MGRVKSALIKRTAKNMLRETNKFNASFENNKKILGSSMPSKRLRNRIAGYLGRLKTIEKEKTVTKAI